MKIQLFTFLFFSLCCSFAQEKSDFNLSSSGFEYNDANEVDFAKDTIFYRLFPQKNGLVVKQKITGRKGNFKAITCLLDKDGKTIVPYKYDDIGDFHEGLAEVSIGGYCQSCRNGRYNTVTITGKHGFIDETGEVVIPLVYKFVDKFSKGLAPVRTLYNAYYINKKNEIKFTIDTKGLNSMYAFIGNYSQINFNEKGQSRGIYSVYSSIFVNFIDALGRYQIPKYFKEIQVYRGEDTLWAFKDLKNKYGFWNEKNEIIYSPSFDEIEYGFWKSNILVKENNQYQLIKAKGKEDVFREKFEDYCKTKTDTLWIKRGIHWLKILESDSVLSKIKADKIKYWRNKNYLIFGSTGLVGISNTNGKEVLKTSFQEIGERWSEGKTYIKNKDLYGAIDSTGTIILPIEYDKIGKFIDGQVMAIKGIYSFDFTKEGQLIKKYWSINFILKLFVGGIFLIGILIFFIAKKYF
ncbi:WG repeat-containing protein [Lacihabitans sp. LS3-19]|uniref:WG repeat-containing protein n=1 Tax=Lacihabitans sp. LS3-19 TaxID=2487335 RepID=UPI0020CF9D3C|nr:WG repeat-containing protein [Lacihabitans sp. LS3-19]MCP9770065.1 WG repeat-containing protein [Lacihabitans sp. LS3-19]